MSERTMEQLSGEDRNKDFPLLIKKLVELEVGRAIQIPRPLDVTESLRAGALEKAGLTSPPSPDGEQWETVGYILPADDRNLKHVVLFNDGIICVIEYRYESKPGSDLVNSYKEFNSPSPVPLRFLYDRDFEGVKRTFLYQGGLGFGRLVARGDEASEQQTVLSSLKEAINTAAALKEKRRQTASETSSKAADLLKGL